MTYEDAINFAHREELTFTPWADLCDALRVLMAADYLAMNRKQVAEWHAAREEILSEMHQAARAVS